MNQNEVIISGILSHSKGVGFKLSFPSKQTANHYKEMIKFILQENGLKVSEKKGYFDQGVRK